MLQECSEETYDSGWCEIDGVMSKGFHVKLLQYTSDTDSSDESSDEDDIVGDEDGKIICMI